ncbi:MAG: hypothetical protein WD225_06895, partial [Ilumatobacteraceae bacterium]
THDWLIVGGGAVFLIAGFLPWLELSFNGFGSASASAFDFFFTGIIPWLIFVAIGVLTFLSAAEIFKLPETVPVPTVFLGASALGLLLVIIRFFYTQDLDRAIGLFLALIAAVVVVAGTYMNFTASGGNLAELGQSLQQKANSAQNKGGQSKSQSTGQSTGDSTPPPPPGDEQPPPPPSS